ncbi:hypothetical protein TNIN_484071 [Trichonephila inaurata madagascariensis]|uniref:Uncharacterized protein n=1 Tax=Trichonephila inaurata madagascariensis TaxID=2747483 RepID=A0A8X6X3H6_9ARAC|nr:hypothetical protein TNIN_484071 [Trichonephila inaurata madagascariensis]
MKRNLGKDTRSQNDCYTGFGQMGPVNFQKDIKRRPSVFKKFGYLNPYQSGGTEGVHFQKMRGSSKGRDMDQLVTVSFTDEYFLRTEEFVSQWARSWRSKYGSTGDCSLH